VEREVTWENRMRNYLGKQKAGLGSVAQACLQHCQGLQRELMYRLPDVTSFNFGDCRGLVCTDGVKSTTKLHKLRTFTVEEGSVVCWKVSICFP